MFIKDNVPMYIVCICTAQAIVSRIWIYIENDKPYWNEDISTAIHMNINRVWNPVCIF